MCISFKLPVTVHSRNNVKLIGEFTSNVSYNWLFRKVVLSHLMLLMTTP